MLEPTVPQELLNLVQALNIAVYSHFMSQEHAGVIWKQVIKASGFDISKENIKEVKKDGVIKES